MLRVLITSLDNSYSGVFETADPDEAAAQAVANLISGEFGFFPENRAHKTPTPEYEDAWGIVLMEGQDPEDAIADEENVYTIFVTPFTPNVMIEG